MSKPFSLPYRQRVGLTLLAALLVSVVGGVSCARHEAPVNPNYSSNPVRYGEIRRLIRKNFHLSLECGCVTGDPDTVAAVKREVGEGDITVLVDLLADEDDKVAAVASAVVATFGEKALVLLHDAARSQRGYQSLLATAAIAGIEGTIRRGAPTPTR